MVSSFELSNKTILILQQDLEHAKLLPSGTLPLSLVSDNIELDSLRQRTALSNCDNISFLHGEAGAAMSVDVLVTLLITLVLGDVVEVVPTNDNGALHLSGDDKTLDNLTTNGDVSREGALLVDIVALNGGIGGFDPKTDIFDPAHGLHLFSVDITLTGDENSILRLTSHLDSLFRGLD
eukprot:CCRYP_011945-RC/>CCRYP_011945-RC protein AED:0.47 eAED:0.52 QI:0/0/0/1/0/0/3/0/178